MKLTYRISSLKGLGPVPKVDEVEMTNLHQCPVCKQDELRDLAELENSMITAQCSECGHIFHRRGPSQSWLLDWYTNNWDRPEELGIQGHQNVPSQKGMTLKGKVLEALIRGRPAIQSDSIGHKAATVLEKGAAVLDIGCGYGDRLVKFRKFGAKAYGIEPSPHRANYANKRGGLNVKNLPIEEVDDSTFGTRFDMVFSNHVVEHIYDPHAIFRASKRVLKPGGWICITIPNVEGEYLLHDFFFALHIHFYSPESMSRLAWENDFHVSSITAEHQLTVLAQYRPDVEKAGSYPKFLRDKKRSPQLEAEDVVSSLFQCPPSELKAGQEVLVQWGGAEKKHFGFFDVAVGKVKDTGAFKRSMLIKIEDASVTLPVKFCEEGHSIARFWVK